ncbi:NAD(P)-dependent dehydrogenase, short-chain alcohol dehydrogenase family [Dyadobacter soli]|uniref:NAD(P)-dependent dehydrogenase, short-chain alcohol dehydrogenase family n=1 Tax=Dyadobacter soli TaxID=659014 RepID=A0A1G7EE52_9BACT|nr:SDR family oxidoreductase [Dyadobacter soli]SDE61929.1 NAD(P)-dependent dehydrogenase, short-chain alcohol dehydrogenase family [Dyadobacter soli]
MDFTNKHVIIVGGSQGIGLATANAFIQHGATVLITGRSPQTLQRAAEEINSPNLQIMAADTSNMNGIADLEKWVAERGKKVDVLYLNAAIGVYAAIQDVTEADFDAQFNTNVKGHFFTLQRLIPHLADGASVIFTSSRVASAAGVTSSIYSATKAALNKISDVAVNELADRRIRVNIVSPGPIQTPGLLSVAPKEVQGFLASRSALQRRGNANEVANTVLFLASDDAAYINGADIAIDGGSIQYMLK